MSNRIPYFKSEEEEVKFWDKHSLDEFDEELEEVHVECIRDHSILPIRLDRDDIQRLANHTLACMWIKERLIQEKTGV